MQEPPSHHALLVAAPDLAVDPRGYVHPRTEEDLRAIVHHARANGLAVRVRGSAHSVPAAIHSDARLAGGRRAIEVVLDRYAAVTFDEARRRVTVQAGCRFGRDPRDVRRSTADGLCAELERRGWALPNLAGVSHATVAGFLSTGSAGGSVSRTFHDAVVGLRLVDGTGEVRELSRESDPERFAAVGVSMGLCGIVSTVTLQCVPRFDIIGSESVVAAARAPFDLTRSGPGSLEAFLRETPYARVFWWPQRGVDKLVVWQARPMTPDDYDEDTGPSWSLERRPYRAFDPVLGSTLPVQAVAGAALTVLGGWRSALEQLAGPVVGRTLARLAEHIGLARVKRAAIDAFVPEDRSGPRRFWDSWWQGLPMDDDIDERLLPTTFTEIWVPLRLAHEAMRRLRDLYERDPRAAGSFLVEIYAAGESPFWLSPSYGEPRVRFNVFWLEHNPGDPRVDFFPRVWDALGDLDPRMHWAKLLPLDARATAARLARSYPRWDDFARVRAELDPDGLFLTSYWRAFLGLDAQDAAQPVAPLPRARDLDAPADGSSAKWPAVFAFEPADPEFVDRAAHVIRARGYVPAPPERVHSVVAAMDENHLWIPGYVRTDWLTERGVPDDAVMEEVFRFMTIRVRVLENVAGRRWLATVLACSLPLGTSMVVRIDFEPAPDGGTDVDWRVAYDLPAALAPLDPLVQPLFHHLFARSLEGLARYLGQSTRSAERRRQGAAADARREELA